MNVLRDDENERKELKYYEEPRLIRGIRTKLTAMPGLNMHSHAFSLIAITCGFAPSSFMKAFIRFGQVWLDL